MAKYTMELRELISTFGEDEVKSWFEQYELSDYLTQEEIAVIEERGVWSKEKLTQRIIDHFYTREIGSDAIGQWMLFVKDKMHEVMETYVPLIYSSSIKFDPLVNVDYTEQYDGSNDSTNTSNSKSTGSGLTVNSDTPQGQISKANILNGSYASSTGANETENDITDNSNSKGNQSYKKTVKGNSGVSATAQALIEQYRKYIRALDTEIVHELEDLFVGLY